MQLLQFQFSQVSLKVLVALLSSVSICSQNLAALTSKMQRYVTDVTLGSNYPQNRVDAEHLMAETETFQTKLRYIVAISLGISIDVTCYFSEHAKLIFWLRLIQAKHSQHCEK